MVVSVAEVVGGWRLFCRSGCYQNRQKLNQPKTPLFLRNAMPVRFTLNSRTRWTSSIIAPRAEGPQAGDQNPETSSQEDLWYVGKLVAGSVAGAAVIKYGSALFPEITTPNIVLALLIITAPVLLAVVLLIKESLLKS
ncbi:uncharacterized protein LOC107616771 [Arachis ipaensis]|uniref:uncharacterized protein LOC107616771 n=1 Tax=Arachis ipaensis TaxID=130454 RepID=UPI0007AFC5BB|nr:uncharacterized protein LOC107616771 [Arachis ipaensis]